MEAALQRGSTGEAGQQAGDEKAAIAFSPVAGSDWAIAVKMDRRELFKSVDVLLWRMAIAILGLSLLGTVGAALLLRPLVRQLANRTETLEEQVRENDALLHDRTAALDAERYRHELLQETLQQLDELRLSARQVAEGAAIAGTGADRALKLSQDGSAAADRAVEEISILQENMGAVSDRSRHLSDRARQVGAVATLVGDLATQTNMLALNASIEAGRAGERGKGFSVVAAEIRTLADRSGQSARKITSLLAEIQEAIEEASRSVEMGARVADSSRDRVKETATVLDGMSQAIGKVNISSKQISRSTQEQASAIEHVVRAIDAIEKRTTGQQSYRDPGIRPSY